MVKAFKDCWKEHQSVPSRRQLEVYLEQHNFPFRWKSYLNVWGGLQRLAKLVVEVQNGTIQETELYRRSPHKRKRRPIPLGVRTAILKRDSHRCVKCGASPQSDRTVKLEVDHIIPISKEGTNDPRNLQTLCSDCNSGKSNQDD